MGERIPTHRKTAADNRGPSRIKPPNHTLCCSSSMLLQVCWLTHWHGDAASSAAPASSPPGAAPTPVATTGQAANTSSYEVSSHSFLDTWARSTCSSINKGTSYSVGHPHHCRWLPGHPHGFQLVLAGFCSSLLSSTSCPSSLPYCLLKPC